MVGGFEVRPDQILDGRRVFFRIKAKPERDSHHVGVDDDAR